MLFSVSYLLSFTFGASVDIFNLLTVKKEKKKRKRKEKKKEGQKK